jgi:hypothetical protein
MPAGPEAQGEVFRPLSPAARERSLRDSQVANDAFWFYAVYEVAGVELANRLNEKVVRQFGSLEMARLLRQLRVEAVSSAASLLALLESALELFVKDVFQADLAREGNRVHLRVQRCFAYEGVRRAGLEGCYRCGPGQRLKGWLSVAAPNTRISPEVELCQMAKVGTCAYTLTLEDGNHTER